MKAVAYARYSTGNQTENSIEFQISAIKKYCDQNNIRLHGIYHDSALTGTETSKRSDFLRMCAAAKDHYFDTVVIYDVTRGSRDVADWFYFRKTMAQLDVKVLSVSDHLGDIYNPADFLQELLTVGIGHHHVLVTREKTIDGVTNKAKNGVFLGGVPPLGYDVVNGAYIINPEESIIVQKIFNMYASGKSYDDIIRAVRGTVGKRGRPLGKNSLHSILKNERYIGVYTWNKRTVKLLGQWAGGKPNPNIVRLEDAIPRIIDDETWKRVQMRMNDNKKNARNTAKNEYLLSGLVRCAKCGGAFVGFTSTNKKGYKTRYYTCANKRRLKNCDCKNINASELEELVIMILKDNILNGDLIERTADEIINACSRKKIDNNNDIKRKIAELNKKITNIYAAIEDGLRSDGIVERLGNYETEKSVLEKKLENMRPSGTIDRDQLIKKLKGDAETLHTDGSRLKELIQYYITKIEIADTEVKIHCISNLTTNGCGGAQQSVFTFVFARPFIMFTNSR